MSLVIYPPLQSFSDPLLRKDFAMEVMNEQPKKLYRSRSRMLGGVCGGLAEYWNVDPTLIRVAVAVLFFVPVMPVVLPYLIMWLLIPERK